MAPAKRTHDNGVAVNSRKRARFSNAETPNPHQPRHQNGQQPDQSEDDGDNEDDENDEDDDESEREAPGDREIHDAPPATQYDMLRDRDFSHLDHEDEDDQMNTQRLQQKMGRSIQPQERVADNGIIQSITCMNFMCHENLTVELGPLLNFIVGENGSGKSAVLTAIQICLGGKASATNRAGSLKALIKEGQDTARLTVKLKNEGEGAFWPDMYGDTIVVERQFSKSGSSSFKIKSATGRTISAKKNDMEEISEYFGLQVDNPLNVLSQDNARQFLNSANASQKYKFFVDGVQLQALDSDYRLVSEMTSSMEARLSDFASTMTYLGKQHQEASRRLQRVNQNKTLHDRQKLIRAQMVWLQVQEHEVDMAGLEKELEEKQATIQHRDAEIVQYQGALENASAKREEAERQREELRSQVDDNTGPVEEARKEVGLQQAESAKLQAEERNAKMSYDRSRNEEKKKAAEVKAEKDRIQAASGDELVQHNNTREQLEATMQELIAQQAELARAAPRQEEYHDLKARSEEISRKIGDVDGEITASRKRIEEQKRGKRNVFAAFDQNLQQALERIKTDRGFSSPPLGPIGLHTHLSDPTWAFMIDKLTGGGLNSFIVRNSKDRVRLDKILKDYHLSCSIVQSRGARLDTTGKEPDPHFLTIMRALKFDDPIYRDVLIIQSRIEQIILIEDRETAQNTIIRDDGTMPRNVVQCITFRDRRRPKQGLSISNNRNGATTTAVSSRRHVAKVCIDDAAAATMDQENIERLQQERESLQAQLNEAAQSMRKFQQDHQSHMRKVQLVEKEIRGTNARINSVTDTIADLTITDGRLEMLGEELAETQKDIETQGRQYAEVLERKNMQHEKLDEATKALSEAKLEAQGMEAKIEKADRRFEQFTKAYHECRVKVNELHEAREILTAHIDRLKLKIEARGENLKQITEAAKEVHPERVHVPIGVNYDALEKQYEGVQKQIRQRRKELGMSDEEARARAARAEMEFEDNKRRSAQLEQDLVALRSSVDERLVQWRQFQRSISSYTRCNFEFLLSERSFRGSVKLDHKAKKLEVEVEPDAGRDDMEEGTKGRGTKTLSGGEKSYSSVCLLLAIWEAMGSPLRCLDEFDVFMDNVNRAISTKMLIGCARRSVGRQYIFITPNAIEGAQSQIDKDVKIIRLTDPRQKRIDNYTN